jgi:hypothetical protein
VAKITVGTPMWRNDGRNGLKIPKSSISKRFFSFQKTIDLQGQNTIFRAQHLFTAGKQKRYHSSTISCTRIALNF